jgi:predicted RNase H-like HicB family nuclease
VQFEDYKIVLYRQQDNTWVAEIPAIKGCYAVTPTIEAAVPELKRVFGVIEQEYIVKGLTLPSDTTKIMHTMRSKSAGA